MTSTARVGASHRHLKRSVADGGGKRGILLAFVATGGGDVYGGHRVNPYMGAITIQPTAVDPCRICIADSLSSRNPKLPE